MDDKELLSLYFNRDERAIRETERRYGNYCFTVAMNLLKKKEDAEETVNDTYLKAWESIPPLRPKRMASFLGRITRNLCLNRIEEAHAEKREGLDVSFEELSEVITSEEEKTLDVLILQRALNAFLAGLPKSERVLFVKRYWYNESIETIAFTCHMTETNVKVRLHRTRNKLRKYLIKEGILPKEDI